MAFSREGLQEALRLTLEIKELGEAEDWEAVIAKDEQRLTLLKSCLDEVIPVAEKPLVESIIAKIQYVNDVLMTQAGKQRDEVQQALQLLQKRKGASSAYDNCPHSD
ncbi:MAG: flagellar protein FliT [Gammaproteobacteria bacterium]|nr:flagellar protein FliT [Gammaproteobacteria bacterium]